SPPHLHTLSLHDALPISHRAATPSRCSGRPPRSRRQEVNAAATRRGLVLPGIVVLAALAVLLSLGTWQLDRKAWKEALIATLDRSEEHTSELQSLAYIVC